MDTLFFSLMLFGATILGGFFVALYALVAIMYMGSLVLERLKKPEQSKKDCIMKV